jgi:hypothetical protein
MPIRSVPQQSFIYEAPVTTHIDGGLLLPPGVYRMALRYSGGMVEIVRVGEDYLVREKRIVPEHEAEEVMAELEGRDVDIRLVSDAPSSLSSAPVLSVPGSDVVSLRAWRDRVARAEARVGL